MSNSNIHLVGEEDDDGDSNSNYNTPIFSKIIYKGDPREQTLLNYLKEVICPFFSFNSFSFVILLINFIVFIISLIPNGLEPSKKGLNFFPLLLKLWKYWVVYGEQKFVNLFLNHIDGLQIVFYMEILNIFFQIH